jgi:hypothetical protein
MESLCTRRRRPLNRAHILRRNRRARGDERASGQTGHKKELKLLFERTTNHHSGIGAYERYLTGASELLSVQFNRGRGHCFQVESMNRIATMIILLTDEGVF